jgi:hypothetical protein
MHICRDLGRGDRGTGNMKEKGKRHGGGHLGKAMKVTTSLFFPPQAFLFRLASKWPVFIHLPADSEIM